jgi:hypothetical protein
MQPILITGHTYLAPEWTPLEVLTAHNTNLLNCAMYMGELETTRGVAHAYKHDETRRTIYVVNGIAARYTSITPEDGALIPFNSTRDALTWWKSEDATWWKS